MGDIEIIATFEGGIWKTFTWGKPSNSLNSLKPGMGVFIKAKNNAYWHFDGNVLTQFNPINFKYKFLNL